MNLQRFHVSLNSVRGVGGLPLRVFQTQLGSAPLVTIGGRFPLSPGHALLRPVGPPFPAWRDLTQAQWVRRGQTGTPENAAVSSVKQIKCGLPAGRT